MMKELSFNLNDIGTVELYHWVNKCTNCTNVAQVLYNHGVHIYGIIEIKKRSLAYSNVYGMPIFTW